MKINPVSSVPGSKEVAICSRDHREIPVIISKSVVMKYHMEILNFGAKNINRQYLRNRAR